MSLDVLDQLIVADAVETALLDADAWVFVIDEDGRRLGSGAFESLDQRDRRCVSEQLIAALSRRGFEIRRKS